MGSPCSFDQGENDRRLTASDIKPDRSTGTRCQIEFRLVHIMDEGKRTRIASRTSSVAPAQPSLALFFALGIIAFNHPHGHKQRPG